jgi:hypothetical protein
MGDEQRYLNARQAAAYLGVKRQRVYDLVAAGRLLPISPGLFVFTQAALDVSHRSILYQCRRDCGIDVGMGIVRNMSRSEPRASA